MFFTGGADLINTSLIRTKTTDEVGAPSKSLDFRTFSMHILINFVKIRTLFQQVSLAWRLDREMRGRLVLYETGFTRLGFSLPASGYLRFICFLIDLGTGHNFIIYRLVGGGGGGGVFKG